MLTVNATISNRSNPLQCASIKTGFSMVGVNVELSGPVQEQVFLDPTFTPSQIRAIIKRVADYVGYARSDIKQLINLAGICE